MLESKRRLAVWGLILVALAAVFVWLNWPAEQPVVAAEKTEKTAPAKPRGLPVKASSVLVGDLVEDITAVGTVVANESVRIRTEIAGRLTKLNFDDGLEKTVQWYLENESWWKAVLDGSYKLERLGQA